LLAAIGRVEAGVCCACTTLPYLLLLLLLLLVLYAVLILNKSNRQALATTDACLWVRQSCRHATSMGVVCMSQPAGLPGSGACTPNALHCCVRAYYGCLYVPC
jgi:hypothetical protein